MASLTIDMALEVLPRRSSSKRHTSPEAPVPVAPSQVHFCSSVAGGVRVLHDQARRTAALLRRPPSMRSRVDAWGVACGAGSLVVGQVQGWHLARVSLGTRVRRVPRHVHLLAARDRCENVTSGLWGVYCTSRGLDRRYTVVPLVAPCTIAHTLYPRGKA